MVVPAPPADLGTRLTYVACDPGSRLHRVATDELGSTEFANCDGPYRRFSPVWDGTDCMGALYVAETLHAALRESVFHDVELDAPGAVIFYSDLLTMRASELELLATCNLTDFQDGTLGMLGVTRDDLIDTPPPTYPETLVWAQAVIDCTEGGSVQTEGLLWNSRKTRDRKSMVFFGRRTNRRSLRATVAGMPLARGVGLVEVMRLADDHDVVIEGLPDPPPL